MKYLLYLEDPSLKNLKTKIQIVEFVRKNPLKKRGLVKISKRFRFSQKEASQIAGVSVRTYQRRKPNTFLSTQASELSIKLAELYETGLVTFDRDENSFLNWLNSPIPAISNKKPVDLITSSLGIDVVKDELLRIEHGIY